MTQDQKWKLVPVEPTPEMLDAGRDAGDFHILHYDGADKPGTPRYSLGKSYAAMLAAAPTPPASAEPQALTWDDALRIARGCTDYGGGHRGDAARYEAYQDGIQTVITALTHANAKDPQTRALMAMGAAPSPASEQSIYDAIDILTTEADSLRDCHTKGDDDWTGEPEAKAAYDRMLRTVAGLRGIPASEQDAKDGANE